MVRFPILEAAVRNLAQRQVMTRDQFDVLDQDARRVAFTVARVSSIDALSKIQQAITQDVAHGGTLQECQEAVEAALGSSALAANHIETVYRTNVGAAYTRGLVEVLEHPLVRDEFPYLAYHAIHDSRTRPEHQALETLGLDGTNVYRRDDPIWQHFLPPWDFNCRCGVRPLSIEDAARQGVREARQWLAGTPPIRPEWVPVPAFRPSPGFAPPSRREAIL